jgi:site-specific recombinase XerD
LRGKIEVNVEHLREAQQDLMQSSRAQNTVRAYKHSWGVFTRWCESAARQALPATSETVGLFVAWSIAEKRSRLETVRTDLSAIKARHEDAGYKSPVDESVKALVSSAARQLREAPAGKLALPVEYIRSMSAKLVESGSLRDMRDHAMLLLTFASGWRRSEIVALRLCDVWFERKGLRLRLGASKTDRDGSEGREIGIPLGSDPLTCPVRTLRKWVEKRGAWSGPLFTRISQAGFVEHSGLSGEVVNKRLKKALKSIGKEVSKYGAHSLRAGMVTAAAENGAELAAIMQRTGHKSVQMVLRYIRPARVFRADPLKGVL